MRLTLAAFGLELDVTFGVAVEAEDDGPRDLGYTGGTFLSFTSTHDVPADVPGVDRNNGWGDEE